MLTPKQLRDIKSEDRVDLIYTVLKGTWTAGVILWWTAVGGAILVATFGAIARGG